MEWKPTLQGVNGPSTNAFWWVVVKIYGLLENFNTRIAIFEGVLDFNLLPHPLAWTQGPDAMEWKLALQGIYGPSMNAFCWVVAKIWTSRKL